MKIKKFAIDIGIKFIGAVLSSWAIYLLLVNVVRYPWSLSDLDIFYIIALIIGLVLLSVNFSEYME